MKGEGGEGEGERERVREGDENKGGGGGEEENVTRCAEKGRRSEKMGRDRKAEREMKECAVK